MIEIKVSGAAEVAVELQQVTPRIQRVIGQSIGRLMLKILRTVKQNKLSGQVLHVRTGRLRRSIHESVTVTPELIEGTVGTDVVYARAHEFGFRGEVGVKAHLRTIKQAFGRSISPVHIAVSAHSRNMKLPERSFLRSTLQEMRTEIVSTLTNAVHDATEGHA